MKYSSFTRLFQFPYWAWSRAAATPLVVALGIVCSACDRSSSSSVRASGVEDPTANAADEYLSLYSAIDPTLMEAIRRSDDETVFKKIQSNNSTRMAINRLVWATQIVRCDWGIDYDNATPDTDLSHVGTLRELSLVLGADARLAMRNRDSTIAFDNTIAIVRMSQHVQGRAPIEVLASYLILQNSLKLCESYVTSWTSAQRSLLVNELSRIDPKDPFQGERALKWHTELVSNEPGVRIERSEFDPMRNEIREQLASVIDLLSR